ncbi:MAG: hypothetical protein K2X38_20560 [Gemmataceae bacterium]|nr:hypothetical protein [Gemmataceae bacterium]
MKIASAFSASLILVVGLAAWAQDSAPRATAVAGPDRGKVLLLTNDRGLEGQVERVGDRFRIRRPVGELWVPADKAKRVCAAWSDALAHMRSEANLADPDERIRLARWCTTNGLRPEALDEAKAALELRPQSKAIQQMVEMLKRASDSSAAAASGIVTTGATDTATTASPPQMDIGSESYAVFVGKVQPILMNTCASCHATGKGGEFRLFKAHEGGAKVSAMRNLASVLAYVTPDRPTASPVLAKAVSAHGTATNPPIQGRRAAPFRTLESWVETMIATHPHLRSDTKTASAAPPTAAPRPTGPTVVSRNLPRSEELPVPTPNVPLDANAKPLPLPNSASNTALPLPSPTPPAVEAPSDEFDPLIFNRTTGPKK